MKGTGQNLPPRDAGLVDTGIRDAETSTSTPEAGLPEAGLPEAGFPDATDVPSDGGPDGGSPNGDAQTVASGGEIFYGELQDSVNTVDIDAWAEIQDRSGAVYAVVERSFTDFEGGRCDVRAERLISGTPLGYGAEAIELTRNPDLVHRLLPVAGTPGRFEPSMALTQRIFAETGDTQVRVASGGSVGELVNYVGPLLRPDEIFVSAPVPPGSSINAQNGITFTWLVGGASLSVWVEIYDAEREVTVRCEIANDGMYTVPMDAITAWRAESPVAPSFVELYTRTESTVDMGVVGGGTVPVDIRVRRGARFLVQ